MPNVSNVAPTRVANSQYAADYPKFHGDCVFRTDQLRADTEIAYHELEN